MVFGCFRFKVAFAALYCSSSSAAACETGPTARVLGRPWPRSRFAKRQAGSRPVPTLSGEAAALLVVCAWWSRWGFEAGESAWRLRLLALG